jgi:hypothetical protein
MIATNFVEDMLVDAIDQRRAHSRNLRALAELRAREFAQGLVFATEPRTAGAVSPRTYVVEVQLRASGRERRR